MTILLSKSALAQLNPSVKSLQYQPEQASAGIIHIGIGAFHRAHQAVFTDDLIATGDSRWKITAVSLRSPNIRNQMQPQDNLYSVVERSLEKDDVSIVGAIEKVLVAPENPTAVIEEIASPNTKVVTITVTEKGYCRDKSGLHLDLHDSLIAHDLTNLLSPKSMPGFIVSACKLRQASNEKLTIISCDNLPSNGDVTKIVVMEFARAIDEELADWIEHNVNFCNSMVDRIVPATTAEDIEQLSTTLGYTDNSLVITEPFKQWVIEDNFANDKPDWQQVGALFVKEVAPFEDMKLRLLNGAHSTLAYIGTMMGYEFIHQAVNDKSCLAFVKILHRELLGTLEEVPNIDLPKYADSILERFANSRVPYKTMQVASDGSQKLTQRLMKPAEIISSTGKNSQPIAFVIATWCHFLEGVNGQNEAFTVIDPLAAQLSKAAVENKNDEESQVIAILKESGICNDKQLSDEKLIGSIVHYLTIIHQKGVKLALEQLLATY